jgi:TP901 family phage tail tape measure protein
MAVFSINTIFGAIDKFSGPVSRMEAANKRFMGGIERSMGGLGKKIINVRDNLIGLAANLSIAAVVGMGFQGISQFQDSLTSFSAVSGVTGKDLGRFKNKILEVGTDAKKSAVDVSKSFELIGSAKSELLQDEKALGQVSAAAITLSKASRVGLEDSTTSLVGVLNMFNLKANESLRAVNALAAGEVVGAARTSQVNDSIRAFGAGAEMMNVSLEQSISMVEVLSQKQIFGAEAGTKLRNILSKMSAAKGLPKEAIVQFQKMGINIDLVSNKSIPFERRLTEMAKATKSPVALMKIFGEENKEAAAILLNNVVLFKDWTKQVTGTNTAVQQADINSKTFTVRMEELKNKFINLAIVGNESSGTLNLFGKGIGFVTDHLGTILGVIGLTIGAYAAYWAVMKTGILIQGAFNVILGISAAFQSAVPIRIGANVVALTAYNIATKAISASTAIWSGIQWLLNVAFLACPIVWIILGIMALVGAVIWVCTHWSKFVGWLKIGWEWVKKMGKGILSFLLAPLQLILKVIAKLTGADWASDLSGKISSLTDSEDTHKAVNLAAAQTSTQTSKYEEVKKEQVGILLTNKTDKNATITRNTAPMPQVTSSTQTTW